MNIRLFIKNSGQMLKVVEMDKDHIIVGRSSDCDIALDDVGVSVKHLKIEKKDGVYVLQDLKSSNGTFIRGDSVTRHHLNNQDEIFLGKHSITFVCQDQKEDDEIDKTSVDGQSNVYGLTLEVDSKTYETLDAYLCIAGVIGRQNIPITKTGTFWGKDKTCDFFIEGWFIQWFIHRRHILLLRDKTAFRLIHLGTRFPPKVNGVKVDDQQLEDGSVIEIAGTRFIFHLGSG